MPTETYCIDTKNLTKRYSSGFALNHLNLQVPTGSVMGLIGENGAGKTTTLKLLLNLIKKEEGSIRLLGLDPEKNGDLMKEQIGVVFDENHFHDSFSATDISKIMRGIYSNWDDAAFQRYLHTFQLPRDKKCKEFSRGMKMKLSIAVALSHHPKLLILDEATSGLDPVVRDEILSIFFDFIQDESHTILMSSHITGDLEKIADYITFLHEGKVVFSGVKDDIMGQYGILKCGNQELDTIDPALIVKIRKSSFGCEVLVNDKKAARRRYPNHVINNPSLEEIMVFYVKGENK